MKKTLYLLPLIYLTISAAFTNVKDFKTSNSYIDQKQSHLAEPASEDLSVNNFYFSSDTYKVGKTPINIRVLTQKNIRSYLGVPKKVITEFSDYFDEKVTTFTYTEGEISFIKNDVLNIDIKRKGSWGFAIKRKGKITKFYPGQDLSDLPNFFPTAFKNKSDSNVVQVTIANAKGETGDTRLNFTLSKSNSSIDDISYDAY
jgi:hypothetical protein